jgi:hypothetical protein
MRRLALFRARRADWASCNHDRDRYPATCVPLESTATPRGCPFRLAAVTLDRIQLVGPLRQLVNYAHWASTATRLDLRSRQAFAAQARFLAAEQTCRSARLVLLECIVTRVDWLPHQAFAMRERFLRHPLRNAPDALLADTAIRQVWLLHLATAARGRFQTAVLNHPIVSHALLGIIVICLC